MCVPGEDFVGRISTLAYSVSHGVRSTRLSLKVAAKYKILLHLRLTRQDMDVHDPSGLFGPGELDDGFD